jgi:replicative DNA helicase
MAKERVAPHNLDAERAVLGAILVHGPARHVAFAHVQPSDFFRDAHRKIFAAMLVLSERGVEPDLITLREELSAWGLIEDVGGPAYVSSLADGVPRSANVEYYAGIVREKARLRSAIQHGTELARDAYAEQHPAIELVADMAKRLAADIGTSPERPATAAEAAREYTAELDAGTALLHTGYLDADNLTGGIGLGDLTIVAARPSVGKTTMTLGMAKSIASTGRTVAYFTLEMKRSKMAARLMSWEARVQTTALERGLATENDYAAIADAQAALEGLPLFFDEHSRTLLEVDAWCRRLRDETGDLAAVFVDYMQLMVPVEAKGSSRQEQVAGLSRGLKRLGKDLKVAVVALSQLSRAPEARTDKRPQLADLRESGALEQDADMAVLLYRPEMHKKTDENKGIAELIVAKNRTGPVGVTRLYFDADFAQFRDLAHNTV